MLSSRILCLQASYNHVGFILGSRVDFILSHLSALFINNGSSQSVGHWDADKEINLFFHSLH